MFVQELAGEQIMSPVSRRSVQHPVSQSAFDLHFCSQTLAVPTPSTQLSPEQQVVVAAQLLPCPAQSPAS
jgi:hypothetical protein